VGDCPLFPDDYQPRDPKASPLYRLLDAHYDDFKAIYEERFQKDYGYWRPVQTTDDRRQTTDEKRTVRMVISGNLCIPV